MQFSGHDVARYRLGNDAIIRKVRIGGWRANDEQHIITTRAGPPLALHPENDVAPHVTRHPVHTGASSPLPMTVVFVIVG